MTPDERWLGAVVVEWARERFDEATARWCFGRLSEPGRDPGWLHRRHAGWGESGQYTGRRAEHIAARQ